METTTTMGCNVDGMPYFEGDLIPSEDNCEKCYCMKGEVLCVKELCPLLDERCVPLEIMNGSCCPAKYECGEL